MVDWLFEQGHEPLWLTTGANTRAERFYSTAGWRRQGTEANGELRFELTYGGDDCPGRYDLVTSHTGGTVQALRKSPRSRPYRLETACPSRA